MFEFFLLVVLGLVALVFLGGLLAVVGALAKGIVFLVALPFKLVGWVLGAVGTLLGVVLAVVLLAVGLPIVVVGLAVLSLLVLLALPLLLVGLLASAVAG
jgi:hypothetical protein